MADAQDRPCGRGFAKRIGNTTSPSASILNEARFHTAIITHATHLALGTAAEAVPRNVSHVNCVLKPDELAALSGSTKSSPCCRRTTRRRPSPPPSPTSRPGCVDEILLVDDGSKDNTVAIAREMGLTVIVHEKNTGYGGNQKTCYKYCLEHGADVVVMIHPDYQYDAGDSARGRDDRTGHL